MWHNDAELFSLMREMLFPAVVGDILDGMGHLKQFLSPAIKPLRPDMVVIGRAMPVLQSNCFAADEPQGRGPLTHRAFGLLFEALDDLQPGEVYLATGATPTFALWGGLMTTRALHLKAAGAVLDGWSRDTGEVLNAGLPVFSHGGFAQDQGPRGKVVDWRVAVEINGVRIAPGDLIFGDLDGVLVIPRAAEVESIRRALEKVSAEHRVRDAIAAGMSTVEAFRTYGVM